MLRLKFRIEDGGFELHRKVPYDYDSEYQDKYLRIATALVEGHIDVHKALAYQTETKRGLHTARSGLFLRSFPGRLLLYPLEASTCAVIFFGGGAADAAVAAVCGVAAGGVEWAMGKAGRVGSVVLDVLVGTMTGVIAGMCYRHAPLGLGADSPLCLQSIFLGTLYWFFYGTAFVIGLLEIIAGELETGVTRFIAVSVKTFVLCLGAGLGMMLTLEHSNEIWKEQAANCGVIELHGQWWRVPLYLLCSASTLGQYRLPIVSYWRGLVVQLVAYETQYQTLHFLEARHKRDNMDYAASNIVGSAAAVVTACMLSWLVEFALKGPYYARLLNRKTVLVYGRKTGFSACCGRCMYGVVATFVRLGACLGLGRDSELTKLAVEKKIAAAANPLRLDVPAPITLAEDEENVLVEAIIGAQDHSVWSVLMPAVYQLVPGAMIAKLWFNSLFPPVNDGSENFAAQDNVFSNLMVISTSLAIGLLLGFAFVRAALTACKAALGCCKRFVACRCCCKHKGAPKGKARSEEEVEEAEHDAHVEAGARARQDAMFSSNDDPEDGVAAEPAESLDAAATPISALDVEATLIKGDGDDDDDEAKAE